MIAFMNTRSIPIKERWFFLFVSVALLAFGAVCFTWHLVPPFLYLALLIFIMLGWICNIKVKKKWKVLFLKNICIFFLLILLTVAMAREVDDVKWVFCGAFFPTIYFILWVKGWLFEWRALTTVSVMALSSLICAILIVCGAHMGIVLAYFIFVTSGLLLLRSEILKDFFGAKKK